MGNDSDCPVFEAAMRYTCRGWRVVPIPHRSKNPGIRGWQRYRLTESDLGGHFNGAPQNIGVLLGEPSGWIIDLDLDHPRAIELAPQFLPATPAVFGRTSKPRSHWIYRVTNPLASKKFSSRSAGMLLELRSTGLQTVVPPSVHESGEPIAWEIDGAEPALVSPEHLLVAAQNLASAIKLELGEKRTSRKGPANVNASPPAEAGSPVVDRNERCLESMLRIHTVDQHDGSSRLFAVACRTVEHDLSDAAALALIRQYAALRPFPKSWTDEEVLRRVRDAERRVDRGSALKAPEFHMTDVGNAERFARQHGDNVRFCHAWQKWLVFDGRRWAIDDSGDVMRLAKRTVKSIYTEASQAPTGGRRQLLAEWAMKSERRDRIIAMLMLAQSELPIPVAVRELDSHPWLLNCQNGTLELRTGTLREHRREDFLTKLCPIDYPTDPGVDPVLWAAFLERIFAGNAELIGFVQRLIGSSLIGEVFDHILPIFYGTGSNGKSVLLETVCGALGEDYAMKAATGMLMAHKSDRHPTEVADLHGKRLVAAVETSDGGRLSEALVKELTGGDSIRARRMREDFWQFRPSHTVILATNHRPVIYGADYGIWRRIRLVPFTVTISKAEEDRELGVKLRAEWPAILRWAVAGCREWQNHGLDPPVEVASATEAYRAEMDTLGEFISERCQVEPGCQARASNLYRSYKAWAEDRGEYIESQTRFGTRLGERGFEKAKNSRGCIVYRGIGLATEGTEGSDTFPYKQRPSRI